MSNPTRRYLRLYGFVEVEITDPLSVVSADLAGDEDGEPVMRPLMEILPQQLSALLYEGARGRDGYNVLQAGFTPADLDGDIWRAPRTATAPFPARDEATGDIPPERLQRFIADELKD